MLKVRKIVHISLDYVFPIGNGHRNDLETDNDPSLLAELSDRICCERHGPKMRDFCVESSRSHLMHPGFSLVWYIFVFSLPFNQVFASDCEKLTNE